MMTDATNAPGAAKARTRKRLILLLVGVILVVGGYKVYKVVSFDPNRAEVIRVEEADRIALDSEEGGVHPIGIEVPPRAEMTVGNVGWRFVEERLMGRRIRIERGERPKDPAGWILGYIYYPGDDGKEHFLNEEMLRLGYARVHLEYPNDRKFRELFEAAQAEAKQKKLGIWQDGYVFPGH